MQELNSAETFFGNGEVMKKHNKNNVSRIWQARIWLLSFVFSSFLYCDCAEAYRARAGTLRDFETRMIPASAPERWETGAKSGVALWSGIRRSTDNGKTWFWIVPESPQPFGQSVQYFNAQTFFTQNELVLLSEPTGTWKTKDSGKSWKIVFEKGISGISFSDEMNGWLALNPRREATAENYITQDGGNTWKSCGDGLSPHHAQLLAKTLSWGIATSNNTPHAQRDGIVRSADGGCSWKWVSKDATAGEYNEIQFLDEKQGWIVGEEYEQSGATPILTTLLRHTIDGGVTWQTLWTGRERVLSVYFADAQQGWVDVGTGFMSTRDGGRNWRRIRITGAQIDLPIAWAEGQFRRAVLEADYRESAQTVRKSQEELEQSAIRKVLPKAEGFHWPSALNWTECKVEVAIDADGNVEAAKAINLSFPELMLSALEAAKQWKFPPGRLNGSAQKIVGSLSFTLRR